MFYGSVYQLSKNVDVWYHEFQAEKTNRENSKDYFRLFKISPPSPLEVFSVMSYNFGFFFRIFLLS